MNFVDFSLCRGMLPLGASNSCHRTNGTPCRESREYNTPVRGNKRARPVRVRSSRFQVPITWAGKHGLLTRQYTGGAA